MPKPQSIIIHGPQGRGKTLRAAALARHFGLAHVVDDEFVSPYKAFDSGAGVLYLTHEPPPDFFDGHPCVMAFDDAVAQMRGAA